MSVGKSDFAESEIVLGRDPVFQEGHVFLLKSLDHQSISFKILDMADNDNDNVINLFKWANPGLFSFFSNTNCTKTCRLLQDSNSDCRSRRRAR